MSDDERMWTGPERVRRALAIAGGWEWCDEHRDFPYRADGCGPLHPPVAGPHSMECLARDELPCICGAET